MVFAYITLPNKSAARRLSRELLDARLAGCTNILSAMESHYVWRGRREKANEVILVAKTLQVLSRRLEKFVLKHHPYDCPCIVFLQVTKVNRGFADWIRSCVAS